MNSMFATRVTTSSRMFHRIWIDPMELIFLLYDTNDTGSEKTCPLYYSNF